MTVPEISILIPLYHGDDASWFSQSLESIRQQTSQNFLVILVIDGPISDGLEFVVQKYEKILNLTIFRLSKNSGLHHALNFGLKNVNTKWVMRFDSDDICHRERVELQSRFILDNPEIDLFGGNIVEFVNDPANVVGARNVPQDHMAIISYLKWRNPFNHMTVCFKAEVARRLGGYPEIKYMEDYALWGKMAAESLRFANMNTCLVFARAGSNMVRKRGGLNYIKSEIRLQKYLYELGLKSYIQMIVCFLLRSMIFISPHFIRHKFYNLFLHRRSM